MKIKRCNWFCRGFFLKCNPPLILSYSRPYFARYFVTERVTKYAVIKVQTFKFFSNYFVKKPNKMDINRYQQWISVIRSPPITLYSSKGWSDMVQGHTVQLRYFLIFPNIFDPPLNFELNLVVIFLKFHKTKRWCLSVLFKED